MAILAYARTSTADKQVLDAQLDALKASGYDKIFTDQQSGKDRNRPGLQELLNYARTGDSIKVYSLSRLSRSTKDAIEISEQLQERHIELISLTEGIDTSTPTGRMFFTVIAAFDQMQREQIVEATNAGLAAARARGRNGGRPKANAKKLELALKFYDSQEMSVSEICATTGLSKSTLYKYVRERREERRDQQ